MILETAKLKVDGWLNVLSGFGTNRDPAEANRAQKDSRLDQQTLEAIYRSGGIGRRIVDIPAEDMTREWVNIEGDGGAEILTDLRAVKARESVNQALRWSGLYGGAVIVMGIDDGRTLEQPVNERNVRGIKFLRVYDRWQLHWTRQTLYLDPENERYGRPEFVTVRPIGGVEFKVHDSRILWFDGEDVPDRIRQENDGWGDSRLQPVYRGLGRYAEALGGVSNIIRDFITPVLKINNLSDLIAGGQEEVVKKRLEILGLSQAMLNVRLIDGEGEDYQKHASSVSGIADLLEELKHNLSAITGIPQTRLFGRSPAGQNSTGESDIRNWYDTVKSEQESRVIPNIERMVQLLDQGRSPEDRKVVCNPLWQPTAQEQATTAKTWTEAMALAIDRAMVTEGAAAETLEAHGIRTGYES